MTNTWIHPALSYIGKHLLRAWVVIAYFQVFILSVGLFIFVTDIIHPEWAVQYEARQDAKWAAEDEAEMKRLAAERKKERMLVAAAARRQERLLVAAERKKERRLEAQHASLK